MNISEIKGAVVVQGTLEPAAARPVPIVLPNFDEARRVVIETRNRVIEPLDKALQDLQTTHRKKLFYKCVAIVCLVAGFALPIIFGALFWPSAGFYLLLLIPSVAFAGANLCKDNPSDTLKEYLDEYLQRFYDSNPRIDARKRLFVWQSAAECLHANNRYTNALRERDYLDRLLQDSYHRNYLDIRPMRNTFPFDRRFPSPPTPHLPLAEREEHDRYHTEEECCAEAITRERQLVEQCFQRVLSVDSLLISAYEKIQKHGDEGIFEWLQNPTWVHKTMLDDLISKNPNSIVQEILRNMPER